MALKICGNTVIDNTRSANVSSLIVSGALCAGQSTGTSGQVLQSTGSGLCWGTVSSSPTLNACKSLVIGGGTNGTGSNDIAIGYNALKCNTSGHDNIAQGYNALKCNTSGWENIALGKNALSYATGYRNIALGTCASKNEHGYLNVSVGNWAGEQSSCGCFNIAIGHAASQIGTSAKVKNVAIGCHALWNNCGSNNIAIGSGAGKYITYGHDNTIVGPYGGGAGICNTIAIQSGTNVLKVDSAGALTVNGSPVGGGGVSLDCKQSLFVGSTPSARSGITGAAMNNFSFGYCALTAIHYGGNNFAVGRGALGSNADGWSNIAVGYNSLNQSTGASYNIALGESTLHGTTTGSYNTAIGNRSLYNLTTGSNNIALGRYALHDGTTPCHTIAIGFRAAQFTNGYHNIALGRYALRNDGCGQHNIAIGMCASMYQNSPYICGNIAVGYQALNKNTTGQFNIAIGHAALRHMCNGSNDTIAIGAFAMQDAATSFGSIAIGSTVNVYGGNFNVSIGGCKTMYYNTTGCYNVAIGSFAGYNNTTGHNNVFLGYNARGLSASCSNTITLGNSCTTTIRAHVTSITSLSDYRDKTDIQTLPIGLEFLRQVRPVKFTWNMRDGGRVGDKEAGFIAQELKKVVEDNNVQDYLELVIGNQDGSRYEATPGKLLPVLVKAIQELAEKNDELMLRVSALESIINNK